MTYNIEIFVVTYNRALYLRETLNSIVNQSVKRYPITVLDNGSTDETPQVVSDFFNLGVRLERSETNQGHHYNYSRAKELASHDWAIVFHDDDLMHPDYMKAVIQIINENPSLSMILGTKKDSIQPDEDSWWELDGYCLYSDISEIAGAMYSGLSVAFSSAVYKVESWKNLKDRSDEFGKIVDTPILFDSIMEAGNTGIAVVQGDCMQYRIHDGRDSTAWETGPFADQIYALNREYKKYCGLNPFKRSGRSFISRNFIYLLNSYFWIGKPLRKGLLNFLKDAWLYNATTFSCILFGIFIGIPRYGFRFVRRALHL